MAAARRNKQRIGMNSKSKNQKQVPFNQGRNTRKNKLRNKQRRDNIKQRPLKRARLVSAPSAVASGQVGRAPKITMSSNSCRVKHREMVTNITGSLLFAIQNGLPLNPGLFATFPWLSTMASSWEEYRFHKLKFCYFTRCGTGTSGSVLLIPDYDASDPQPVSEQVATTYRDVVEDAPWKDIDCQLNQADLNGTQKRRYVRSGALGPNEDIKQYDSGNLFIGTVDSSANAIPWGKLWVEYDVEFFIPQINGNGPNLLAGGAVVAGGTITIANPLGTVPTVDNQAQYITVAPDLSTTTVSLLLPGDYLMYTYADGSGFTGGGPVLTLGTGVTQNGSSVGQNSSIASSFSYRLRVTAGQGSTAIGFSYAGNAAAITTFRIYIARVPSSSLV